MAIVVFTLIGIIPNRKIRKYVNDILFKAAFRLMCRPLSAVVTFHNTHWRPKTQGFCVANHTSPIDVAILGADCTYSLVRKQILGGKGMANLFQNQKIIDFHIFAPHIFYMVHGHHMEDGISVKLKPK